MGVIYRGFHRVTGWGLRQTLERQSCFMMGGGHFGVGVSV